MKKALDAKVKVSGGELRFGQYLNKALVSAEDEARAMGDEYVSVEHLFLSLLKNASPSMRKIFGRIWNYKRTVPAGSAVCQRKSARSKR